jgi:hypothetical protein
MNFAKRVYLIAAIYGILVLAPQYFLIEKNGNDFPPPITHPEYYYGFVGLALVWQIAFLIIRRDPVRFRPIMPVTILEKVSFGVPAIVLYAQGRLSPSLLAAGLLDLLLGALFAVAYIKTPSSNA